MIAPGIPENEADRLATLYQLKILDTEREERLDRITRIDCKLFDVPIAVISFLEIERQWMKSDLSTLKSTSPIASMKDVTEGIKNSMHRCLNMMLL